MRLLKPTCVLVLLATLSGCQQPVSTTPAGQIRDSPQVIERKPQPLEGTLSCSGRGCHADLDRSGKGSRGISSCSYSLWLDNDPHANAYRVLSEPRGQEMAQALGIKDVTAEPRCLACHVTPQAADLLRDTRDQPPPEEWVSGVGCESCHGSAEKWLVPHRDEVWRKKYTPQEKEEQFGLKNLTTLAGRARVCAGCHVGAPADPGNNLPLRDMNHDHIAAGHPRLMFEFSAFLANEPPHWKERFTGPDALARAWLVGQVVAAEAALDLLADRAKHANTRNRPWPEFSEYDCYACHHHLTRDSWRAERGYPKGAAGRLRLASWYPGLIDLVAPLAGAKKPDFLLSLAAAMRRPSPPARNVAQQAVKARAGLTGLVAKLENLKLPTAEFVKLRKALAIRGIESCEPAKRTDWDEAEQLALGILAMVKAEGNKDLESKARNLLKLLGFPPGYDSRPDFRQLDEKKSPFEDRMRDLFKSLQ
jgi:hypothetical protein